MRRATFRLLARSAAAIALLAIAGCSAMSEKACLATDWRTIGYEDGVRGRPADRIADTRRACADYGIRADLDAYRDGRAQGLREYCRPDNGYHVGLSGADYTGVCPADLERGFLAAYEDGHRRYVLQARVRELDDALANRRRELHDLQHGVAGAAVAVVEDGSTAQDRIDAVIDTAHMAERIARVEDEIRGLEARREESVRALDEYVAANDDDR